MFERYTERARRVVFFARYEASQYGSHVIETEHLLLGLLRVSGEVVEQLTAEPAIGAEIREEIERRITRTARISTSIELPLSEYCKKALTLAGEMAATLRHQSVAPEHLLASILQVEESMAAELLRSHGLQARAVQDHLAKMPGVQVPRTPRTHGIRYLQRFLAGLTSPRSDQLLAFFAKNAEFVDLNGKLWERRELESRFDTLFAPYAKRNATSTIESILADTRGVLVARVLWRNALLASGQRAWMHQMSAVLVANGAEWEIAVLHVTVVRPS